jgi:hypothetical protein
VPRRDRDSMRDGATQVGEVLYAMTVEGSQQTYDDAAIIRRQKPDGLESIIAVSLDDQNFVIWLTPARKPDSD